MLDGPTCDAPEFNLGRIIFWSYYMGTMKLIKKLQQYSSGPVVFLFFVATMLVYLTILFHTIPAVLDKAPDMKLFDMSPGGYSPTYAQELLRAIGPTGRETYLTQQLPIDFIYPGLFAVTYTLMLFWIFKKSCNETSKVFLLAFVPAAAGLFDYLENLCIISIIQSFPDLNPKLVHISSLFSITKSVFTIGFYILLLYGFFLFFIKKKNS